MKIRFRNPKKSIMTVVELKNFEFLPLFYLFPKELLIDKCPNLVKIPRNIHSIMKQEKWFRILASDYFLQAVCDMTAFYVWPAFGISTYMECFSGYDPMWRLAHATQIWVVAFENMSGITPQSLANTPKRELPWVDQNEFVNVMLSIGLRGINDNNLTPCKDAVKKMRCIEDYDQRYSNAKIDFHRKWYHTRTRFKTVSLDQLIESHGSNYHSDAANTVLGNFVGNPTTTFENDVCGKIDVDNFCKTLKDRDRIILEMRVSGDTYQEIADELDYKTHSAVLKRIRKITNQYMNYIDEQEGIREYLNS